MTEDNLLEVGDKIKVRNAFTKYTVEIVRTTKTQAISNPVNDSGYTLKFKIKAWGYSARLIGAGAWDITDYTVIPKQK